MLNKKKIILMVIIFLIASSLIHLSLLTDGFIINGDFTRGYDSNNFIEDYTPIWNERGGYSNFFKISKLFIYTPLILYNSVSNISMSIVYFLYFTLLTQISNVEVITLQASSAIFSYPNLLG